MLENYKGTIEINGQTVDRINLSTVSKINGSVSIRLTPNNFIKKFHGDNPQVDSNDEKEYEITVKAWMTKPSSPEFDFMARWNNDVPMPFRTMVGKKTKETKGMEYWELHGDTVGKIMCTCLKCGRPLNNPISQYFGLGPECGGHNYTSPFDTEEELENAVERYRRDVLQKVKWSGWLTKSAVISCKEI